MPDSCSGQASRQLNSLHRLKKAKYAAAISPVRRKPADPHIIV